MNISKRYSIELNKISNRWQIWKEGISTNLPKLPLVLPRPNI